MKIFISESVDSTPLVEVVTGVATHPDIRHGTVLTATGARSGNLRMPATWGLQKPAEFVRSFGVIRLIWIETTGSYGAGLAWYLRASDLEI